MGAPSSHQRYGDFPYSLILLSGSSLRHTHSPARQVRYTEGGSSIARFALAVDRRFKGENGPTADFPNCVAFGKTAEFIEKYFHKGMRMGCQGRIQTGSYTNNDGQKVYTTDVVVENCEFVESKGSQQQAQDNARSSTLGAVFMQKKSVR